jgi:hypothetical protein
MGVENPGSGSEGAGAYEAASEPITPALQSTAKTPMKVGSEIIAGVVGLASAILSKVQCHRGAMAGSPVAPTSSPSAVDG